MPKAIHKLATKIQQQLTASGKRGNAWAIATAVYQRTHGKKRPKP